MRASVTPHRSKGEPTIGLINIVFLMLIFFLIAGTIAPSPDPSVTLVSIAELETRAPPEALVITAEGGLRIDGVDWPGTPEDGALAYLETLPEPRVARLLVDRAAPAALIVSLAEGLRGAGAERVVLLGERAVE